LFILYTGIEALLDVPECCQACLKLISACQPALCLSFTTS